MPHFVDRSKQLLVSTSFKVMYSKLYFQPQLEGIDEREIQWLLAQGYPWYWLVRHPLSRLRSFFLDKFRKNINGHFQHGKRWQACQTLFFTAFGIEANLSAPVIIKRLQQVSFAQFIEALPALYLQDSHLIPQAINLLDIAQRTNRDDYYLICTEKPRALCDFSQLFSIDMRRKVNATGHLYHSPLLLEASHYQMINQLYCQDFATFGYEQLSIDDLDNCRVISSSANLIAC